MTVRELIEKLQELPPDLDVHIQRFWQCGNEYEARHLYDIAMIIDCKLVSKRKEIVHDYFNKSNTWTRTVKDKKPYVGIFIR